MSRVKNNKKPDVVGRVEKNERNGQDMPVLIFQNWCKGCMICVEFCPEDVLEYDSETGKVYVARPENCTQCGRCELRCPDFAITRVKRENGNGTKKVSEKEKRSKKKNR